MLPSPVRALSKPMFQSVVKSWLLEHPFYHTNEFLEINKSGLLTFLPHALQSYKIFQVLLSERTMSHFKGDDIKKAFPDFQYETSILTLLSEALRNCGDAPAMIEGQTDKRVSFSDLLQLSSSIASGLQNAGVTEGDYVVLCCEKSILSYSVLLGVWFTGATAVLAPTPDAETIHKLVGSQTVKAVFSDAEFMPSVTTSVDKMSSRPSLIATVDTEDPVMASILTQSQEFTPFHVKDPNKHIPLIVFSSGTTADPKGIQISDITLGLHRDHTKYAGGMKLLMIAIPLYWINAVIFFLICILNQVTLIVSNRKEPDINLTLIEKHKVESWFTGIGSLPFYIQECSKHHYDLSSLKRVFTAGEAVLHQALEKFVTQVIAKRIDLILIYGSSETGFMTVLRYNTKETSKTGSCGTLGPGFEMKILDSKGSVVPVGSLGDFWVKSISLTPGYWNKPELTRELMDKDGFFNLGDVGFFDSEGFLYFRGRSCDLITFKENKISPTVLEDILYSHPAVLEAAIVGKSHPTDGQHATAYVVTSPGSKVSPQELAEYLNGQVSDHERLRGGVLFLDVLPRSINGKILRTNLRNM